MNRRLVALILTGALALTACAGDDATGPASSTSLPDVPSTEVPATGLEPESTGEREGSVTDPGQAPVVSVPDGASGALELGVTDLEVGAGTQASAGDTVTVHYVGVSASTGETFDASWARGMPFGFVLGNGEVIQGWDQGVEGMRVGGRRQLVIPADLAYGDRGVGAIAPGETLVFVVDLLDVTPAP